MPYFAPFYARERAGIAYDISYSLPDLGDLLLEGFKVHIRVDHDHEDSALTRFINTAAALLQDNTRRILTTTSVVEYYDIWPWDYSAVIACHRAPVVSITSVKYYDSDAVQQTWGTGNYQTDLVRDGARIVVDPDATVNSPALDDRIHPVELTYVAGYGSTVADIPAEAVNAIFTRAAYLYDVGREIGSDVDVTAVERCWQSAITNST